MKARRKSYPWLVVAALLFALMNATACVPSLMAQSAGTGALAGTVTDTSGGDIANVKVAATNIATGQTRTAVSGPDGTYKFSLLASGQYRLEFSAQGFRTSEVALAVVNVTETTTVNQVLKVGSVTQTITVEGSVQALQTESSTVGGLVGEQTITTLPLTNRNYTQILGLSAGTNGSVNNASNMGRGTQDVSVNGNNTAGNNFQMDGVGVNNFTREGTNDDFNIFGGMAIPNPDAIQEFVVQTSTYDASFGRNPGANVNVVTKSGTNQFHGTAFEFFRNAVLNANDFFSKSNLLDQNQFGGVVGGPIKKNKIFFFASYQGTRSKNGIAPVGKTTAILPPVPSGDRTTPGWLAALGAANCAGPAVGPQFGGQNIACDGSNISPVALNILQLKNSDGSYYFPTSTGGLTSFTSPARYVEDQVIANGDYLINPKNSLHARYLYSRSPQYVPLAGNLPGEPQTWNYGNDNALLKLTSLVGNNFVNEARVSYQLIAAHLTDTPPPNSAPADLGMTPIVPGIIYPPWIFFISNGFHAFDGFNPVNSPLQQFQLADQIAWVHGRHSIRSGIELEKVMYNLLYEGFERGSLNFLYFNDFLVGGPGNILGCMFCVAGPPGGVPHHYRANDASAFIQDDWKVNSRLTLNLGLRWEFAGMFTDVGGNLTGIWPSLLQTVRVPPTGPTTSGNGIIGYVVPKNYVANHGVPPDGVLITRSNYSLASHPPYSNFAPRVGFAWQPTHSANLVVRAGAGIFYDRVGANGFFHGVEQGPPYSATLDYGPGTPHTLQDPFASTIVLGNFPARWSTLTCAPDGTACSGTTSNLSAPFVEPYLHTPLVRQYNLGVEYEFAPQWVLSVGYVGSSGINLYDEYHDINAAQLASPSQSINGQTGNTLANVNLRVPVIGYGSTPGLQQSAFDGKSRYDSLQITLKKQFTHGLALQAAFTWSRSLTDLNSVPTFAQQYSANSNNPLDFGQQYGPSGFNRPRRFVVNYQYELPFGAHSTGFTGKLASGWNVAGVTVVQDGTPITIYDGRGGTIYGNSGNSRAQLCQGVTNSQVMSSGSVESRLGGYFNANAFCAPPVLSADGGTGYGDSAVGIAFGPGQFNWDFTVLKNTKLTENQSLQFRTEFYNLFNHPQFTNPINQVGPTLGRITGTSVNQRIIQFALKYIF
jgi:hypothetical protein